MSKDIHKLDSYESCVDAVFIYPNDGPFPSEMPVLALWDEGSKDDDPYSKAPKIIQHVSECVVEPETPKALQAFQYVGYTVPAVEKFQRYAGSAEEYYKGFSVNFTPKADEEKGLCYKDGCGIKVSITQTYPPEYDMSNTYFPIGEASAGLSGSVETCIDTDSLDGDSKVGYGTNAEVILEGIVSKAKRYLDGYGGTADETFGGTLRVCENVWGVDSRHEAHGIDLSTTSQGWQWEKDEELADGYTLAAASASAGIMVTKSYHSVEFPAEGSGWCGYESGNLCVRFDRTPEEVGYLTDIGKVAKGLIVGFPTVKSGVTVEFNVETSMSVDGQRTVSDKNRETYESGDKGHKVEGWRVGASVEDIGSFKGSVLVAVPFIEFKNELINGVTEWKFCKYVNVLSGYSEPTASYTKEDGWKIDKEIQTVKVTVPESHVVMFYMCADPLWNGVLDYVGGASAEADCCKITNFDKSCDYEVVQKWEDLRAETVWGCASVDQVVRFCGSVIKIVSK